ncbi:MAG: OmpH family outer membrane protein [Bdellovibrionaceae bacterium]|nr:OmpH family outer membrane protein [Pseudobdellovibrionaceae bacterium]
MRIGSLILIIFFSSMSFAQIKMGFVDLQKAVQSTSAGKKAKSELDADFAKRKRDLDRQEQDLRRRDEELQKKRTVLSEAAYRKQLAGLEKSASDFRDLMGRTQMEFQKKELDLTTPILEKMRRTISRVAKENGYTVVMEMTAQVLYSPESDDLTDRVAREFEKEK